MTTYKYRTDVGLPAKVYKLDGKSLRKKLPPKLNLIVVHYTGMDRSFGKDDPAYWVRQIHKYKANEYNYVIAQDGTVIEFAGQYEAIHCANYNDKSYGILMLNGTKEPLTDAQIAAFAWLRNLLHWTHQTTPSPVVKPHKDLRATACPGQLILSRWSQLVA